MYWIRNQTSAPGRRLSIALHYQRAVLRDNFIGEGNARTR